MLFLSRRYQIIALTAFAYAGMGYLANFLAIPPGYASPVWPSAGVALGMILKFGYRTCWGIWLGSFLINCYIGWQVSSSINVLSLVISASIGLGAVLQAIVGKILLSRLFSDTNWLTQPIGITQFLILGGPVSCLVGSTWGNIVLLQSGIINIEAFFNSWLNWWIGDTLGVLVLLPITTVYLTEQESFWSLKILAYSAPTVLALILTVSLFISVRNSQTERISQSFIDESNLVTRVLEQNLNNSLDLLYAVKEFMVNQRENKPNYLAYSRTKFNNFTRELIKLHDGIQAFSWTPIVTNKERQIYEQTAQNEGLKNFEFTEYNSEGKLVRAQSRQVYFPIYFIQPRDENKTAIGFDLGSESKRVLAMKIARDTGKAFASDGIRLIQETEKQKGVVAYIPIYTILNPQILERKKFFEGVVAAVFRIDDLLNSTIGNIIPSGVCFNLIDASDNYNSLTYFPQNCSPNGILKYNHKILFAQRQWILQFYGTKEFFYDNQTILPWFVLTSGCFLTSLMGAFVLSLAHRTILIDKLVQIRTKELKEAQEEAVKSAEIALAASKAKTQFLAVMSHEIRTPMNGIIGFTQLLLESKLNSEQREFIEIIYTSSQALLNILKDILDFSNIESNRLEINPQPLEIKVCLENVINLFLSQTREKGLSLIYHLDNNLPSSILADSTRLSQILINLVSNAIKFTQQGQVTINVNLYKVENEKIYILFSVQDTGIGIGEEQLSLLFEAFSQGDSSINRRYGGTGLGLAICQRLSQLMGGEIWVQSKRNEGSTFFFTIATKTADLPTVSSQSSQSHPNFYIENLSILLAEDNPINQKVAKLALKKLGYSVDTVDNGSKVLEACQQKNYHIILMDIQMPVMDGLTATRELYKIMSPESLPYIIALTAQAQPEDREECLNAGMMDYISKPFQKEDLEVSINRAIEYKYLQYNQINSD